MATRPMMVPPAMATAVEFEPQSLLDQVIEKTKLESAARYMPTLTVKQFTERQRMLLELKELLIEGVDYGVIPGTDKPTLLKPGAEKICAFFGYSPCYQESCIEDWRGEKFGEPLFYYKYICTLQKDRADVGQGVGSCNSWESKYRYRVAGRKCPKCNQAAIMTSKFDDGGFYCNAKKGGCGAKFKDGDPAITSQQTGRVPNPDFADIINTVQKMGQKRAYIAATLSATGASQYFTQDVEDQIRDGEHFAEPEPPRTTPQPPRTVKEAQAEQDAVLERKLAEAREARAAQEKAQQPPAMEDPKLLEYWRAATLGQPQMNLQTALDVIGGLYGDLYELIGDKAAREFVATTGWTVPLHECVKDKKRGHFKAIIKALYERLQAGANAVPVVDDQDDDDSALPGGAQGARR